MLDDNLIKKASELSEKAEELYSKGVTVEPIVLDVVE